MFSCIYKAQWLQQIKYLGFFFRSQFCSKRWMVCEGYYHQISGAEIPMLQRHILRTLVYRSFVTIPTILFFVHLFPDCVAVLFVFDGFSHQTWIGWTAGFRNHHSVKHHHVYDLHIGKTSGEIKQPTPSRSPLLNSLFCLFIRTRSSLCDNILLI